MQHHNGFIVDGVGDAHFVKDIGIPAGQVGNHGVAIKNVLNDIISKNSIDTITLSSTHLLFLKSLLENEFPDVEFIDSRYTVAEKVFKIIKNNQSKRNSLKIFTSGNPTNLKKHLVKLKIKNKVSFLSIWL